MNAAIRGSAEQECQCCKQWTERTFDLSETNKTQYCEECINDFVDFVEDSVFSVEAAYREVFTKLYL